MADRQNYGEKGCTHLHSGTSGSVRNYNDLHDALPLLWLDDDDDDVSLMSKVLMV